MDSSGNENQELVMLKQFWNRYGKLLAGALLITLVFVLGTRYWQQRKWQQSAQASQIFQEMVIAEFGGDAGTAKAKCVSLIDDYGDTPYAQLAGLSLAKMYLNESDLDKAAEQLRLVTHRKDSKHLSYYIATVRLAQVLLQQSKYDEALQLLAKDPDPAYLSLYAQTRGDLYVAKNDVEAAKRAYTQALNSAPEGIQPQMIQMKLLDLGGENNA